MVRKREKKQILIVEDNEINRMILSEILSDEYQVLEAENGLEALHILRQNKDSIDIILLDVMMPVMDGYTFLDKMKEDDELSTVPVIVMTQGDSEEDEISALAHGATDFVPKPYRPRVILHRVASIINLRETAAMVNQFKYDQLTGVYSKEFFYRKVREELQENPDEEYTIICSNIENFKLYNDAFGREAGDRLLQEYAYTMVNMVGKDGICGRYGADRFLIFSSKEREQADRKRFILEIADERPRKMENINIKWGVYEITDSKVPVEQMCDRALLAADSIKGQYNQHMAVYDDTLRGKLLREKAVTDAMETALRDKQFIVYLQPKYSLKDECMAGAEALVRWIHPEWGFMSPGEFIPLFEKNGFIPRLDAYVWEQVCIRLKEWREKGIPLVPVSVNVSRADVYQLDLVEILTGLITKYDVDPAYLHLEITESAYAENPGQIISTVEELRKIGFIIEMDDFGSGYSSLNMLSQMNLDILKLDMKFIQSEMAKPENQSILNDIIRMAHRMNLSVVAEGVESREQVKRLQKFKCDYVQGFYFAKPMPDGEFEELLKVQHPHDISSSQEMRKNEAGMRRLLVVDDDDRYRKMVRQTFEGKYEVLESEDAMGALECIRSYDCEGISVVILSMTLPENGADVFLKTLRQDPALWHIPVLGTIPRSEVLEEFPLALETDDFLCKCHPMFDLRRRIEHLVDVLAFHEREVILQDEASRDYLTGLLNRRGLQAAIDSLRKEALPLAVCLFDLDNLKKINDTYGHDMGDHLIQSFADLIRRQTRAEDIQCRYGGDEFLVFLKRVKDRQAAQNKGADICRLFGKQVVGGDFTAACSCGIVLCESEGIPSAELIERADRALYRAKRENKGGCFLWDDSWKSL